MGGQSVNQESSIETDHRSNVGSAQKGRQGGGVRAV